MSFTAKASSTSKTALIIKALSNKAQLQVRVVTYITMAVCIKEESVTIKRMAMAAIMIRIKGIAMKDNGLTMCLQVMGSRNFLMAHTMKVNSKMGSKMAKADIFRTQAYTKEISKMENSMVKGHLPMLIIASISVNGKME